MAGAGEQQTAGRLLEKLQMGLTALSQQFLLWVYTPEINSWDSGICTPMFIAALFTVAERRKPPNVHRQVMETPNVVHPHDGSYSAWKRKGVLTGSSVDVPAGPCAE